MTAREMTDKILDLRSTGQVWDHKLANGFCVRVRCMPGRHYGTRFYLVWATRRGWDSSNERERGPGFSGAKLTALTAATAGKKARSLVSLYGGSP